MILSRPGALGWACFLGAALAALLFFPGFMSSDSAEQLLEARAGIFSDAHPPLMAMIWRIFDVLVSGPFGMLLYDLALVFTGVYLVMSRTPVRGRAGAPLLALLSVYFPPVLVIIGVIWKDVMMAGFLMLGFGLVSAFGRARSPFERWFFSSTAISATTAALATRHNAAGAAWGVVAFLIYQTLPWRAGERRRLTIAVAAALPATAMLTVLVFSFNSFVTLHHKNFWQQAAMGDLVGISAISGRQLVPPADSERNFGSILAKPDLSLSDLRKVYVPSFLVLGYRMRPPLFRMTDRPAELDRLKTAWRDAMIAHPMDFAFHRWNVGIEVLGLGKGRWGPVYMQDVEFPQDHMSLNHASPLSPLQILFRDSMNALVELGLFVPAVYVPLACLMLVLGIRLAPLDKGLIFFLVMSGLGYELSIVLGALTPDFRYSHWLIMSTWLSAIVRAAYAISEQKGRVGIASASGT